MDGDHQREEAGGAESKGVDGVVEEWGDGGDCIGLERAHVALAVEIDRESFAGGDVLGHETDDGLVGMEEGFAAFDEGHADVERQGDEDNCQGGVEDGEPMALPIRSGFGCRCLGFLVGVECEDIGIGVALHRIGRRR